MVDRPETVKQSVVRTFNDVAAQIPLHSKKVDIAIDKDAYWDREIIRIRIPPEYFSVAVDYSDLDRYKKKI